MPATMVVAGVYLVARLFPVYYFEAPEVLHGIAYLAAFTSLFAAVIACVQTDTSACSRSRPFRRSVS